MKSLWMSFSRQTWPLNRYSLSPSRWTRRVISISWNSLPSCFSHSVRSIDTSHSWEGLRVSAPSKMTSCIFPPRSAFGLCSPRLFLWRFARASNRFHEMSRVQSWSTLDLYSMYRDNDYSFYLSDYHPPTAVLTEVGSGANLRAEVQRRRDRHHILGPDGDKYVEVMSTYGKDTAPIYFAHPRHGYMALAIELPEATAWVLYDENSSEAVSRLLFTLLEAVAFWIWQLASAQPGILVRASGPARRLRVTVTPDNHSRWDQVLTGQSPEELDAPEDDPDTAAAPWVAVSGDSSRELTVTILAEHARVLLSGTNLADLQLVTALADALIPGGDHGQADAIARQIAPRGPKRMIHVWLSGDVLLVPAD